ncbi:RHS repeat-associated core domain-containing protein [Arenimonas composti]|uniref:Teneurin-like YD-shell domain-containing protein n=1 Tax=Arenimonas composti TR7-09 = DSM 18010 TaxID=1121013 RepID=A0A091BH08_9GAMM|nr:RHS repeat-associated core domain-containing protein [Arenimonas composti]KFN51026.1 hypothetical protein P873_04580 [Arenimonas composti TR7-09 = DSM 18010]
MLKVETGYGTAPSTVLVGGRPQNVLREVRHVYETNPDGSCPIQWGESLEFGIDYSECVVPMTESVTWQQGVEFVWKELARNAWAMPTQVKRYSREGGIERDSRTDETTYLNDVSRWVIGLVTHERNVELDYITARTDYHGTSRLPITIFWPYPNGGTAIPQQKLAWSAKGVLATVRDGLDNITTLSSWKRGVPRLVTHADTTTQAAVVNDRGQITRVTDQLGFATNYAYDARGLLSAITYPSGDDVAWNATVLGFTRTTAVEYGFPAGTWKRTVQTGSGVKVTWFDALWRPLMTREYDSTDPAGTQRFSAWEYDAAGDTVFTAYPRASVSSLASFSTGTYSEFDALGRLVLTRQDWEGSGQLETLTEFLTGFRTRTTNPRGFQTVTAYQAFDDPGAAAPTLIDAPENQRTLILRDVLGRALTLTRTGSVPGHPAVSRHYLYDSASRLCLLSEPETGGTVLNYDDAGNVDWSAAGLTMSSPHPQPDPALQPAACDTLRTTAYTSGRRVERSYDVQNRLLTLVFPDNTGNQTWTYTADGLPATITTSNNGLGEIVTNAYTYNRRRLMASETSAQPGAYSWTVDYGYSANGHLATLDYPSGLQVDYAPNALGQPTRAGDFATGVKYFPNGAIREFHYGNGIKHTMLQNERMLPERSTDSGGILDLEYVFDAHGNPVSITDYVDVNRNRAMEYDALDRLVEAQSVAFGGNGIHAFSYDVVDNLRSWTRGAGSGDPGKDFATYEYDGTTNRLTRILGSGSQVRHTFTWDAQGNLRTKDGTTFNFDYGNRDRGIAGQEGMRYDGHGRRVSTWMPTTGLARFYLYAAGGQLLFEGNETDGRNTDHIHLGGSLVATVDYLHGGGGTRVHYKHTDALGSPVTTTDENGARVGDYVVYEPFGQALGAPIDGVGFTGHVMDPQSGLVYMQQRYYDPEVGRFLSVDPVAADTIGGLNFNRYNYGNNNPYRFTDPDGRQSTSTTASSEEWKRRAAERNGRRPLVASSGTTDDGVESGSTPSATQEPVANATAAQRQVLATGNARIFGRTDNGREYKFQMDDSGAIRGRNQDNCTGDDRCTFVPGTIFVNSTLLGHVHAIPAGYENMSDAKKYSRSFIGPGDHAPLSIGRASGVVMPSGERYVITGTYSAPVVEYLGGGDARFGAYVQANWRPGMTPSEVAASVEGFLDGVTCPLS